MKKETILYSTIGLLAGLLIAGGIATLAVNKDQRGVMRMMGTNMSRVKDSNAGHMGMSMNDMPDDLKNRSGDDFDKNFISMMIAHHQGAVQMAELAKHNAKHDEVKKMADDITAAQSREIDMMRGWQTDWGYDSSPMKMMGH